MIYSPTYNLFNTIFVSIYMYPENPEGNQVIVGSMTMGYISDIARNRTHNLFSLKWEPIPLYHSDGLCNPLYSVPIFVVSIRCKWPLRQFFFSLSGNDASIKVRLCALAPGP